MLTPVVGGTAVARRRTGSCLAVALAGLLFVCIAPPRTHSSSPPNVVVIVVDTLRADHMSLYGYARPTTPNLDRLAVESVVFDRAFTVMSHTLPAHISLVTGVHPATHQVLSNGWTYDGPFPTLAERLGEAGWTTAAFVSGFPLVPDSGLNRGFDVYQAVDKARGELKIDGELTNQRARNWLRKQGERPFFLLVHYFDTHQHYTTPPDGEFTLAVDDALRTRMRETGASELDIAEVSRKPLTLDGEQLTLVDAVNSYDNLIRRVDGLIEELRRDLEARGFLDNTLLIVTSDHGEGLGQHHYYSHGFYLYEEQLRVPLLVRPPPASGWTPGRVGATVSLLDVMPTVLETCGLALNETLHGHTLGRAVRGEAPPRTLLAQRRRFPKKARERLDQRFVGRASLHAVRGDSSLKYIRSGEGVEELYDLSVDPWERHSLVAERPADVERLRDLMLDLIAKRSAPGEVAEPTLDPQTEEALRELGYVQ
jgi:arylsulfatase A-like enzyme